MSCDASGDQADASEAHEAEASQAHATQPATQHEAEASEAHATQHKADASAAHATQHEADASEVLGSQELVDALVDRADGEARSISSSQAPTLRFHGSEDEAGQRAPAANPDDTGMDMSFDDVDMCLDDLAFDMLPDVCGAGSQVESQDSGSVMGF